jgi:hypothetical protein
MAWAAPTELGIYYRCVFYRQATPTGLSAFWAKNAQNADAQFRTVHRQKNLPVVEKVLVFSNSYQCQSLFQLALSVELDAPDDLSLPIAFKEQIRVAAQGIFKFVPLAVGQQSEQVILHGFFGVHFRLWHGLRFMI